MNKRTLIVVALIASCFSVSAQQQGVNFNKDITFDQAIQLAQTENKKIFIDFYTTWCGPCKTMDKEVFTDAKVANFLNSGFVNLKIDAEKAGEGVSLANRFQVKAYPTFVVLDSKGEELLRFLGYNNVNLFMEKLEKGLDIERSPESLMKRYENGERSPVLINDYALFVLQDGNEELGFKIINDYFNSLTKEGKAKPENLFLYERYSQSLGDYKLQYLLENKKDFFESIGRDRTFTILHKFLRVELAPYANGYRMRTNTYDATAYEDLQRQVNAAELPESLTLDPLMKVVDDRLNLDSFAFLEGCEKLFPSMSKNDRFILMLSFAEFKGNENNQVPLKVVQIIQQYIHEIDVTSISVMKRLMDAMRGN